VTRTRVGLNLLWLVPGSVGGSEQSTLATVRALLDLAPSDLDLRLFVDPGFPAAHPDVVAAVATEVAPTPGGSRARRLLTESTWLAARTEGLDLVHHAGGTVPVRRTAPCVVTIHDLQPLEARATHSALKRAYLARALPAAVRSARRVAVPSAFVRRTVLGRYGAAPDEVVVIPHAVPVRPPATPTATLVRRLGLTGPVVLYAAVTYPHKDHRTLLDAFEAVLTRHPDAILVLPGGSGGAERALAERIARAGPTLARAVRRIGRVPDADIAGLLDLATVVAVPSRYEGFGLPALEAMAAGVPVVVADATALPEVVGDGGRLVDPDDAAAWAAAISDLLDDPAARTQAIERGRARAAAFSWSANAEGFCALYRQALERP
jgi:glycosyltransferase involved in cell wall biosynthesis